jgi:multidrug resistance protein, MATE family
MVLMGFADTVMLGRYSTIQMSAASFGNAVFFQTIIFGIGLLYAVSTLIAIADGEGKLEKSIPIFKSSLLISAFLSVVFILIHYILIYNIEIFGQTNKVNIHASSYLEIVNYATPAILVFYASKQLMDGLSFTKIAMYVTFFGLLLNVFLNWVMIYGNLGFPEMGINGAAWATNVARVFMALLMFYFAWLHPTVRKLRIEQKVSQSFSYFWSILKLGGPIGLTFFFEIAAFSVGLIMAGWISENSMAAHQIAINLASITYMFVTGIAAAATIVVGNYYGAKDKEGIRHSARIAFTITIIIEVVFALMLLLFNSQIAAIYSDDEVVLQLSVGLIVLAAFFQLSDGLQAVGAGVLRGVKETKITGVIALFAYWGIMIPGAYYLAFKTDLGVKGIWISFIVGLSFAAVFLLLRFYSILKKGFEFEEKDN